MKAAKESDSAHLALLPAVPIVGHAADPFKLPPNNCIF